MLASELKPIVDEIVKNGDAIVAINAFGDFYFTLRTDGVETDRHGVKFLVIRPYFDGMTVGDIA